MAFDDDALASVVPEAEATFGSIDTWFDSLAGQDHLDPLHHAALYLYGVGAFSTWVATRSPPRALAGYSLGVYVALHAAGSLALADGLELVLKAGEGVRAAQAGLGHGLLAVNGLAVDRVPALLDGVVAPSEAALTHVNTPTNFLLTCPGDAVPRLSERALACGAYTAKRAAFPGAAHSPFVTPWLDAYFSVLAGVELRAPDTPLYSCVTAERVSSPEGARALLHDQLIRPVRFLDTVKEIGRCGSDCYVVVGACEGIPALLAFLLPDAEVRLWPGALRDGEI